MWRDSGVWNKNPSKAGTGTKEHKLSQFLTLSGSLKLSLVIAQLNSRHERARLELRKENRLKNHL